MRWKVDALIETRLPEAASAEAARQAVQAELWKLVEAMEAALGCPMATSVVILGAEPLDDET